MADKFELILDECIRLVMQGIPVSECLARYPEYAAELESHLATVKQMTDVYSREPATMLLHEAINVYRLK